MRVPNRLHRARKPQNRVLDGNEAWTDPSIWSEEAEAAFWRQRRRADHEQRARGSHGQSTCLRSFFEIVDLAEGFLTDAGIQIVAIADITGSVAKPCQFTPSFFPTEDGMRARWKRAYAVTHGLRGYEPVILYQVRDEYFVEDGHYRISVLTALGGRTIEAFVRVWNRTIVSAARARPATQSRSPTSTGS